MKIYQGKYFVTCSCHCREREGVPCSHFFRIATNISIDSSIIVDVGMVDVRYLKVYNSNYGNSGTVGELMYKAQQEYFENHNKGVLVSDAVASQLKGIDTSDYPILGPNRT